MKPRHKRLAIIGGIVGAVGVAAALVLNAFQSNLVFFYSPSQIVAKEAPVSRTFRLGGLVQEGSVKRDGTVVQFAVTDTAQTIPVQYQGILPDLFKEGKGVVAQGQLREDGMFVAREVLAKHDENYMPPEAGEALKRAQQSGGAVRSGVPCPVAGELVPRDPGDGRAVGSGGGAVILVLDALAGWEYGLSHQDQYRIRVVTNSYGPLGGGHEFSPMYAPLEL